MRAQSTLLTRRVFVQTGAVMAAGQALPQSAEFRTMTYNVLACLGFAGKAPNQWRLSAAQDQMESRMAQELLLYRPDLITFCESVTRPAAERMAKLLAMNYAYFDPGVPSFKGYPIGFPGTLFTRHRIVESENAPYGGAVKDAALFTRHWGRAVIDTGRERLAVFSGHMHPNKAEIRDREINIMLNVIKKEMDRNSSILFQGDLNHTPDTPDYRRWKEAGLTDAFAVKGAGDGYSFNSIQPKERIDYVWMYGPIANRLTEARVLNEGAFRTNPEDIQSFALSDHLPVIARFS